MLGIWVTCKVKPGKGEEFLQVALRDREGTRTEPGNLRFDISRATPEPAPGEPEVFYFFELYRTEEDFATHQQTPHYLRFRDESVELMAEPRVGVRWSPVYTDMWE